MQKGCAAILVTRHPSKRLRSVEKPERMTHAPGVAGLNPEVRKFHSTGAGSKVAASDTPKDPTVESLRQGTSIVGNTCSRALACRRVVLRNRNMQRGKPFHRPGGCRGYSEHMSQDHTFESQGTE